MRQKFKSINYIFQQESRIKHNYTGSKWVNVAIQIAGHYVNQILEHLKIDRDRNYDVNNIEFDYRIRSHVPDTTMEEIKQLQPYKVDGLYYIDNMGKKQIPQTIYFGIDIRWRGNGFENAYNGKVFVHSNCALCSVYLPDGTQYENRKLANVLADYSNGMISNFRKE